MTTLQSVTGEEWDHAPPQRHAGDLAPSLRTLLERFVALLGAEEATLTLHDQRGNATSALTHRRVSKGSGYPAGGQLCPVSDVAFQSRQRISVVDVSADVRFQQSASLYTSNGIAAVHSKPLVDDTGHVIGVFTARFAHPHCFSEAEVCAFDFGAEALLMRILSGQREEQARTSSDELSERNAALEYSNIRLIRSNQDLERFALAASHDLKEPLRTVTGYAQLLSAKHKAALDNDAKVLVSGIIQSAERMSALLRDLMTFAEMGAGGEDDTIQALDLNLVLERAIQNVGISAVESGAFITADTLPEVVAEEIHVLQLFQNLISNSIKYRSERPPQIHVTSVAATNPVEIVVYDNGIGIDPQYHASIFEAFHRLHCNESTGTGMGLTICQRIVQRYGGRIWVESQKGSGTAFHFTLPSTAVIPVAANSPSSQQRVERQPVVLLIDDDRADVDMLKLALGEAAIDWQLNVIEDGEEALTFVRQAAAGGNSGVPDALILDLHLPKHDGIEILEARAENPAFAAVPAIIWSSVSSPPEIATLQRFHLVTYLNKPTMLKDYLKVGLAVRKLMYGGESRSQSA